MIPRIKIYKNKYSNPKFSYVSIIVLTGSIFEKEGKRGISHLIEHLIFKGSEFNNNIKILNNKINSKGMVINAYTTQFVTVFHINTPTEYIDNAIEALVQIVFNPLFREDDIINERKVVINELMQRMNSPESIASIHAQKIMYPKDNPLHNPVIGYIEDLESITKEDVLEYYNKYYCSNNMVFVTSTSKNVDLVEKCWKKCYNKFGKERVGESTLKLFEEMKPKLELLGKPGLYRLSKYFPRSDTIYVLIIFNLPKLTKKQMFELDIFSNYLAGSLSSKLFLELREKKQLIYSVSSNVIPAIESVDFNIDFVCKKSHKVLLECIKTIDKVLKDFYKNGISLHEFKKFKNKTLINYDKIKSSGVFKIDRFINKYYFGISEYNYEEIIKGITNYYLHQSVKEILKSKKEFVFIA